MAGDNRIQITISADASSAKGAVADLRRELDGLGGGAGDAGRAMEGFGGSLGSVRGMLAGLGVLAAAKEFKDLGVAVFETGRQMETLELSFKAITGSAAGARAELASIRQLSRDYGQDFLSMAQSTKTFLAASKDTEIAGSQSREVIKGVSAAVAALGLSSQDAQGVFLALGQMMSKGTVQAEELRGQLGERLPGAFGIAAKAMGVSTAELGKMMEQGQVLATDLVPKMAKALEQEYGQAAKEAGNTGTAAVNQLNSSWTDFKSALADTGMFREAISVIKSLASAAQQAAQSVRVATGTLAGEAKIAWLNQRIRQLESPDAMLSSSLAVDDALANSGAIQAELTRLKNERSLAQSELLESQRSDSSRGWTAVSERERAKSDSLTKASQQATMESWTKSADPGTAAWAKFELARSKSWKEVNSGKIDHGAFEQEMAIHQGVFDEAKKKAAKKDASAATAGAKADIRGSGVLQRVEDEISAIEESLGGNRLGAAIAKIERDHNRSLNQITLDLEGAKGGYNELNAAAVRLGDLRALKIKAAELKEFDDELGRSARQAQEMAQWTGGSDLGAKWIEAYRGYVRELQDAGIQTDNADQERITRADERFRAHTDFLLEEDLRRLGEGGKLSDEYWDAEGRRLDAHLVQVKAHASSETAFNVYASQKRSDLRRQELEARLGYEDSFLGYLKDYLSLEFGLYQDAVTRERAMWKDMAKSTGDYLRQIGSDVQNAITEWETAMWEGNAKKAEESWRNMWSNIIRDSFRYLNELAATLAKNYLVLPIIAQVVGTDSSGLEGLGITAQGGTQGKSSSGLFSKVGEYGGYAKDAYTMAGGGSDWIGSINSWGADKLGFGTAPQPAIYSEGNVIAPATQGSGLGSALGAGAMGATAGWMAGQFLRPDDKTSSYVGTGAGLLGGATASLMGAGAWAGPIGIAAALVASAITAAVTPATRTSTWSVPKASQPAGWVVDGEDVAASYGVVKTTESGFGGSQSTSHATIYDLASSEIAAEFKAGMDASGASLKSFSKSLGQTDDEFRATMKGAQSLMIAIPEGMEQLVYDNLNNLKAEHYLKQMGLIGQADALLRAGESYIGLLNRTETAAATAGAAFGVMGLNLEQMSGSAERLIQGDWASKVIEVMGGADAFTGAMTRFNNWAYSGAEQAAHATEYFGGKAIEALGEIQASGVTLTNFWGEYRARMEAGMMSPEEFGQWANAATWVEQAYNSATAAAEQQVQAEQTRLQAMQATRQELEQQATAWDNAKETLRDFLHSMRTDPYTTLSPTANLAERQQAYNDARARAQSGDLGAQDEFRQYAQDFREFSYDFYGANQDYVAIDQMIQADTTGLISAADMQLAATNEQIARLDADILVSQQILASSSLVNDNLARVAGAVESSGSSIVSAINSLGASASFDGGGQAAAISSANEALLQQQQQALLLSFSGGGGDMSNMWDGVPRYAEGGLITGGIPGVDSVPLVAMPGERIFNLSHSRIIERLAANSTVDTSALERLMAQVLNAVASGNAAVAKLLTKVEANTATVASEMERA